MKLSYYMRKNVKLSNVKWRFGWTMMPVVLIV
jgi:hypothetical protein